MANDHHILLALRLRNLANAIRVATTTLNHRNWADAVDWVADEIDPEAPPEADGDGSGDATAAATPLDRGNQLSC